MMHTVFALCLIFHTGGSSTPGGGPNNGWDISRVLYLAGGATLVYALYDIMKRKVVAPTTERSTLAGPGSAVVLPGDSVTITAVEVPATRGGKASASSTTTSGGRSTGAGGLLLSGGVGGCGRVYEEYGRGERCGGARNVGGVDASRLKLIFGLLIVGKAWASVLHAIP